MRSSMKQGACDSASVGWAMKLRGSAGSSPGTPRAPRRAVRPDQHAVAARLADRFDDERVEMLEHVLPIGGIRQEVGLDVGEDRLLGQVEADDRGNVRVQRLVVGEAGADRVGNRHVAGAIRVQQARHAQVRIGPERQRIEEVVVHAAVDDVHAAQAGGRPHVDDVVVDEQVAAFDERDAHLAREKRVLEIRGVADARREHDEGRVGDVGARAREAWPAAPARSAQWAAT